MSRVKRPFSHKVLAHKILTDLSELGPYIYHEAEYKGKKNDPSIYIKFADERLRSLRIADHNGIKRYRYKWNLRTDLSEVRDESKDGINRFYYPADEVEFMIARIRAYYNTILKNEGEDLMPNDYSAPKDPCYEPEITEFKGNKIIKLPTGGGYSVSFGLRKAQAVLDFTNEIAAFVESDGKSLVGGKSDHIPTPPPTDGDDVPF